MKLWGIFRFEFLYQIRRPWPWLFLAVLVVVTFLMARDSALANAMYEDFHANSPFSIAHTTVFGGLIWLLMAPAIAGEAGARDVATRIYPLFYTASVAKAEYVWGRFLAALALNAILLLAVQVGMMLGVYSPGVDPAVVGLFRPAAYITAYAFIALPNAVVATAIQFVIALRSGRPMTSYVGSLLLLFMGFFVASIVLFRSGLGSLLDPVGIRFIVEDLAHLWTTFERNTRLLTLQGDLLTNRLLWLSVGILCLAVAHARFEFAHRSEVSRWWNFRKNRKGVHKAKAFSLDIASSSHVAVRDVRRVSGAAIGVRKTLAVAWQSFAALAKSWAGLALLVGLPVLTIPVVIDQMMSNGVPLVPTTVQVISELTAPVSAELSRWVIVPLMVIFFAGELVWREREAGIGEISDAMPGSEWPLLLGKILGIGLLLIAFTALQITAGVIAQSLLGYREFEIGLYLRIMFGLQLTDYLLFAVLAVVVHVLVNQKYVAHIVAIVGYTFIALASLFGVEHDLLIYGASPGWSYTEMRGFGPTLWPWFWFKLYWAGWALLLVVLARLLWVRGRESRFPMRVRIARMRLQHSTAWIAVIALLVTIGAGTFVFYNTNVLHAYHTSAERTERSVEYERRYRRFANVAQPQLRGAQLRVELYPERRQAEVTGSYRLINRSAVAIDSIHVATVPGVSTSSVAFDRLATHVVNDEEHGHHIHALGRALQPGDSLRMDFVVRLAPRGFTEAGAETSITDNGTHFTNSVLPSIGYQGSRELISASDRRVHGLAARPLIPYLEDEEARTDRGSGIEFEAIVGTSDGQTAVAPGILRRTWTEPGRRYFHYVTEGRIGGEWSFFSGRYALREARWKDVSIRIYHHPSHTAHLDRVVNGIQSSLDYYSTQFGPYLYSTITVVERPGNGTGMHADASMLSYAEGFSTWNPGTEPGTLDFPYAVVAHEVAHQWTVPYAPVEGAPVMSEGVAWYYAIKAVEHSKGVDEARRLLHYLRQPHPIRQIRRGEPLLRGLDPYLSRRRAPFALYALSVYLGEERVNAALRRLLETHRPSAAPLATTLDLYRELRAVTPDTLNYLLRDFFETNAFWDLDVESARADSLPDGTWQVILAVNARKRLYDSAGVETDLPMNELVQVGVFGAPVEGADALSAPLHVQMQRIRSGKQTLTMSVQGKPMMAGIDPYHLLDWEEDGEGRNVATVLTGTGRRP